MSIQLFPESTSLHPYLRRVATNQGPDASFPSLFKLIKYVTVFISLSTQTPSSLIPIHQRHFLCSFIMSTTSGHPSSQLNVEVSLPSSITDTPLSPSPHPPVKIEEPTSPDLPPRPKKPETDQALVRNMRH